MKESSFAIKCFPVAREGGRGSNGSCLGEHRKQGEKTSGNRLLATRQLASVETTTGENLETMQPLDDGMFSRVWCPNDRFWEKQKQIRNRESCFTCSCSKQKETLDYLGKIWIINVPKPDDLNWDIFFSNHLKLFHLKSSWIQLWRGISTTFYCGLFYKGTHARQFKDERYLPLHRTTPQLRDSEAQQASPHGGWRRQAFCVLPGTVTVIQPDNPPPQPPEFFNICIYSGLSRAWCPRISVLVQSYFMWRLSVTLLSKSACPTYFKVSQLWSRAGVCMYSKCLQNQFTQTPFFRLFNLMHI